MSTYILSNSIDHKGACPNKHIHMGVYVFIELPYIMYSQLDHLFVPHYMYCHSLQVLLVVPLATALCDFGYTVHQGAKGEPVAQYQYVSPIVLALSMVSE